MFRSNRAGWFFILPAFVFLGLFKIVPIGVSVLESLRQTTYTGRSYFVGFENYTYLFFEDPTFWNSFWITLIYSLVVNPLIILIALVMALLLNENHFFTKFFRTVFFLPTAISFAVVSVIWSVVLDPHYGLANGFLTLFGLPAQPFFASTAQALWCLVFLNVWRSAGYWMMYFLAGLQNIPESLYQAADIGRLRLDENSENHVAFVVSDLRLRPGGQHRVQFSHLCPCVYHHERRAPRFDQPSDV